MIKLDIHGPIAHVTLDRPEVHNAFNAELIAAITTTMTELGARTDIRAVVLRGNGKSFSAGADLKWMARVAGFSYEENVHDARAAASMFLAVARCPKPVIARIHGAALGGGSGLAAACDIAIAVESAVFGFTEVKLGIIPAVISPFVISRIGASNAREYFLTGERFPARVAQRIGLIQHVAADEAALDAQIGSRLAEILTASPAALAAAKALIFGVAGHPIETTLDFTSAAIAQARASSDGQAGIAAFLAHISPPWIHS